MSANFGELLGRAVESVEPPKKFPVGSYDAMVLGYEQLESSKKGTPFIRFAVKLLAPRDDVDMEAFEEAGGVEKLNERTMRLDFYLTDDAFFRLRQFLENTLELQASGRTFDQVIPESKNCQFIAKVGHEKSTQKEGEFYMVIQDHAAASED